MMNSAAPAPSGMGTTSLSISLQEGSVIFFELGNGKFYRVPAAATNDQVETIHVVTPVNLAGEATFEDIAISYTCELTPNWKPGDSAHDFARSISSELADEMANRAEAMIPQLFSRPGLRGTTEETQLEYNNKEYNLSIQFVRK